MTPWPLSHSILSPRRILNRYVRWVKARIKTVGFARMKSAAIEGFLKEKRKEKFNMDYISTMKDFLLQTFYGKKRKNLCSISAFFFINTVGIMAVTATYSRLYQQLSLFGRSSYIALTLQFFAVCCKIYLKHKKLVP